MNKFLTAEWRDLVMANYKVDPAILESRIPPGTELDLYDGKCFVSLVGFMFIDTRVLGFLVPFHINFEEVNLRFYIKRKVGTEIRRAVCFVKEIVPRMAIAVIARRLYGEPYECWQMSHTKTDDTVSYKWSRNGVDNRMSVGYGPSIGTPADGSHEQFIIEHYWGYTDRGQGRVDEYKVEHPTWELHSVVDADIDVDFGAVYGDEFAFLRAEKPYSVLMAKGSEIAVYKGERIK